MSFILSTWLSTASCKFCIASRDSFCLKIPTVLEYCTELSVVQVVQKQELRATFEKYGIVDEVYIAQAGGHTAHASQPRDAVLWIRIHMDPHSFWIRIRMGKADPGA